MTRSAARPQSPSPTSPIEVVRPVRARGALVCASPHSGDAYPESFVAASRLEATALRRSEDAFVDALFAAAPRLGVPLLKALFPRAYCDPNREAWELDPAMFAGPLPDWVNVQSPKVAIGLGTIARVVANGAEIYRDKLSFAEAEARVAHCWRPYHTALEDLLVEADRRAGFALLLDCHSMPSVGGPGDADPGQRRPDIALGDCFGTACAPALIDAAERILTGRGLRVSRNVPYAGGYTTQHYGRPDSGRHALQIEINRGLYMDERAITRGPGFDDLAATMTALVDGLADLTI